MRSAAWMSAVACSLALGACSLATPYQRHDGSLMSFGGYYDKQVAEDEFHVAFYINQFTDQETGKEYWRRRSREVCREKGFSDFTVIGDIPPPYHVPPNFFVWKAAIRCVK